MTKTKAKKQRLAKQSAAARGKNNNKSNNFTAGTSKSSAKSIQTARFSNKPDGSSRVTHEEYIRDITTSASGAYKLDRLQINPGILDSFPWLSQIAANYESYRFAKLEFKFKTSMPTTASGFVMYTPDSDPTEQSPTEKKIQLQMEHTKRCPVWNDMSLPIPVSRFLDRYKEYYVRDGPVNNQGVVDLKLYDACSLYISTEQVTLPGVFNTPVDIGELWVSYVVDLLHPQLIPRTVREQNNPNAVRVAVEYDASGSNGFGNAPLSLIPSASEIINSAVTQDLAGLGGWGPVVYDPGTTYEVSNYRGYSGPLQPGSKQIAVIELPSAIPYGVIVQGIIHLSCDQTTGTPLWQLAPATWDTVPTNSSFVSNAQINFTNIVGYETTASYHTLMYFTVQRGLGTELNTPIRFSLCNTLLTSATERLVGWNIVFTVLPGPSYILG
jgi:hypothetical protein